MTLLKKFLLPLFALLISCGGGGGGSEETIEEFSDFLYPVRIGELDKTHLIVAELTSGKLLSTNRETNERTELQTLAPFTGNGLGISGLLVDRNFSGNGYVFVYHGTGESGRNVLTRFTIKDSKVEKREQLLLLTTPSGHNGGGMYQLSNGNILLGIGDGGNPSYSQDTDKLEGKILILSRDGQFIDAKNGLSKGIYALGFRNPFGIDGFNDEDIFVADNGPDCDDEVNLLISGRNYGWRENYECGKVLPNHQAPIYSWSPSQGITDLSVSKNNSILTSHYNTNTLISLKLDGDLQKVETENEIIKNAKDPIIDLLRTENNEILYTTPTNINKLNL
jgi:glucose/arabinose dehydrogenase